MASDPLWESTDFVLQAAVGRDVLELHPSWLCNIDRINFNTILSGKHDTYYNELIKYSTHRG